MEWYKQTRNSHGIIIYVETDNWVSIRTPTYWVLEIYGCPNNILGCLRHPGHPIGTPLMGSRENGMCY